MPELPGRSLVRRFFPGLFTEESVMGEVVGIKIQALQGNGYTKIDGLL